MNKQYIKRQLTLNKLGIPMNKDIQEYYNDFNNLSISTNGNYMIWKSNGDVVIEYDMFDKCFDVNYANIWLGTNLKHELNYLDILDLVSILLELYLEKEGILPHKKHF